MIVFCGFKVQIVAVMLAWHFTDWCRCLSHIVRKTIIQMYKMKIIDIVILTL